MKSLLKPLEEPFLSGQTNSFTSETPAQPSGETACVQCLFFVFHFRFLEEILRDLRWGLLCGQFQRHYSHPSMTL